MEVNRLKTLLGNYELYEKVTAELNQELLTLVPRARRLLLARGIISFFFKGGFLKVFSRVKFTTEGYMRNSTIQDMGRNMAILFGRATENIKIVSGELSSQVWIDHSDIGDQLLQAMRRGVRVRVIVGPTAENRIHSVLKKYHDLHVRVLPEMPSNHFVIVDDRHLRMEMVHGRHSMQRPNPSMYIFWNTDVTRPFRETFEKLWQHSKPIQAIDEQTTTNRSPCDGAIEPNDSMNRTG